jgi:hypothetical protein
MCISKVCNTCSGHKTITILRFSFWQSADKLIAKRHLLFNVAFNMSAKEQDKQINIVRTAWPLRRANYLKCRLGS